MKVMTSKFWITYMAKPTVFASALIPLLLLILGVMGSQDPSQAYSTEGFFSIGLGADPQKYIVHKTGAWALKFLLISLAITPLRHLANWNHLIKFRRMLGLFCFFYASLHLASYYLLYLEQDLRNVVSDIVKRPYITLGFMAWLALVPLALTSTQYMMKKLGKNWLKLHRMIYGISIVVIIHYWWQVKSDINEPILYGLIVLLLLGYRYWLAKVTKIKKFKG